MVARGTLLTLWTLWNLFSRIVNFMMTTSMWCQPQPTPRHQHGQAEADCTADQRWELIVVAGQNEGRKNAAQNTQIHVEQVVPNLNPSDHRAQGDDGHNQRSDAVHEGALPAHR